MPRRYEDEGESLPDADIRSDVDRTMIRKFREQIHALGALWIIIGALAAGAAGVSFLGNTWLAANLGAAGQIALLIIASMGLMWLTLGIMTCLKHLWAVYVGLVLSYLSLLGQIVNFSICGAIIMVMVILQAHRVISWANKMRAAGVPLATKPD